VRKRNPVVRHSATQTATKVLSGEQFHFDTNVKTEIEADKNRRYWPHKVDLIVMYFSMGRDENTIQYNTTTLQNYYRKSVGGGTQIMQIKSL
jgi:hypothetical protein